MRKNTARHWLHAALDLLPVILIPVFMIYSHRHVLTEQTEVDIQYKYQSNEVNSIDDLVEGNIYHFNFSGSYINNIFPNETGYIIFKPLSIVSISNVISDDATSVFDNFKDLVIQIEGDGSYIYIYYSYEQYLGYDYSVAYMYNNTFLNDFDALLYDFEPDVDTSASYFSSTDYNEIESVDVQDTNSSIMNVFMDDFNYSVNKYFNMGNVFNLKDVYHWFEVNIFNNNPPVVMASIYNIIVYEFVMDLLFLLYGLFMWFIDMTKRLIEKPIDSIK